MLKSIIFYADFKIIWNKFRTRTNLERIHRVPLIDIIAYISRGFDTVFNIHVARSIAQVEEDMVMKPFIQDFPPKLRVNTKYPRDPMVCTGRTLWPRHHAHP